MEPRLEADILAASQPLRVPGAGERRVLSPAAVEQLANSSGWPRWKVEALALEIDVAPLHYLRNLGNFGADGQVRLLRASVGLVGRGAVLERAAELLALNGIGSFCMLAAARSVEEGPEALAAAGRLEQIARNRNASCEVRSQAAFLRGGNPAEMIRGMSAVAACLDDSMDEQLLQFACRGARMPLVLGGAAGYQGQATTVFPGDPGVALVYKPSHPHLEPNRTRLTAERQASLMVGSWLAEQVTAILLEQDGLLRGRLLYADMDLGEMGEYPL
jgi:molybdopterin-synthase adenylyltransferase